MRVVILHALKERLVRSLANNFLNQLDILINLVKTKKLSNNSLNQLGIYSNCVSRDAVRVNFRTCYRAYSRARDRLRPARPCLRDAGARELAAPYAGGREGPWQGPRLAGRRGPGTEAGIGARAGAIAAS